MANRKTISPEQVREIRRATAAARRSLTIEEMVNMPNSEYDPFARPYKGQLADQLVAKVNEERARQVIVSQGLRSLITPMTADDPFGASVLERLAKDLPNLTDAERARVAKAQTEWATKTQAESERDYQRSMREMGATFTTEYLNEPSDKLSNVVSVQRAYKKATAKMYGAEPMSPAERDAFNKQMRGQIAYYTGLDDGGPEVDVDSPPAPKPKAVPVAPTGGRRKIRLED